MGRSIVPVDEELCDAWNRAYVGSELRQRTIKGKKWTVNNMEASDLNVLTNRAHDYF